ncbi:MAG: hypothetical protein LBF76_00370 [Holosporales bacterium]|jgi:flagellar biosynthesis GTPase FlhF|nr:hypothetical protein [Holosporales bacterium]
MQQQPTHSFEGKTLKEVLDRVARALGEEAIILESGENEGNVWVTAVPGQEEPSQPHIPLPSPEELLEEAGFSHEILTNFRSFASSRRKKPADSRARLIAFFKKILAQRLSPFDFDAAFAQEAPASFFLVGATGQGKTVTTAKFAVSLVQQGILPVVASLDVVKSGGLFQLEALLQTLDLPVQALQTQKDIHSLLAKTPPHAFVLIDTPGLNLFDAADRRQIQEWREGTQGTPFGLLRAGGDFRETEGIIDFFQEADITRVGVTHCDATQRLGTVLSAIFSSPMTLEFLCDAPFISQTPQTAFADKIVDMLLSSVKSSRKHAA